MVLNWLVLVRARRHAEGRIDVHFLAFLSPNLISSCPPFALSYSAFQIPDIRDTCSICFLAITILTRSRVPNLLSWLLLYLDSMEWKHLHVIIVNIPVEWSSVWSDSSEIQKLRQHGIYSFWSCNLWPTVCKFASCEGDTRWIVLCNAPPYSHVEDMMLWC